MSRASSNSSTILPIEDSTHVPYPATRALQQSRRKEIETGLDSVASLLTELRLAHDDAESQLARAAREREQLLDLLRRQRHKDPTVSNFVSELEKAETRCDSLHKQLIYMKRICEKAESPKESSTSKRSTGERTNSETSSTHSEEQLQQKNVNLPRVSQLSRLPGGDSGIEEDSDDPEGGIRGEGLTRRLRDERCNEERGGGRGEDVARILREERYEEGQRRGRREGKERYAEGRWRGRGERTSRMLREERFSEDRGRSRELGAARMLREERYSEDRGREERSSRMMREDRYAEDRHSEETNVGRTPLPFVTGQATTMSHHLGSNIQQVLALLKKEHPRYFTVPPRVRYRESRSLSRRRVTRSASQPQSRAHGPRYRINFDFARGDMEHESGTSTDLLLSDKGLRRSRNIIKGLLYDLIKELSGIENACDSLTDLIKRAKNAGEKSDLQEQLGSFSSIREERQRQIHALSDLYKQVKNVQRCISSGRGDNMGVTPHHRSVVRKGRGMATRIGQGRRRGRFSQLQITTNLQTGRKPEKNLPLYLKWPWSRPRSRSRKKAVRDVTPPPHQAKVKVLRDMRCIQKGMKVTLGEDRELSRPYVR